MYKYLAIGFGNKNVAHKNVFITLSVMQIVNKLIFWKIFFLKKELKQNLIEFF